ncbi:MAG: phosphoribosylpyrophosphate synthetase [Chitinophagaceae bacterium]
MYTYETVSGAVNGLKTRGYNMDFNLDENCIICHEEKFNPEDFEITEVYRFEGNSDPADEAVVYAIESNKGHKGVLVNGYGPTSETMSAEMARKLHINTN